MQLGCIYYRLEAREAIALSRNMGGFKPAVVELGRLVSSDGGTEVLVGLTRLIGEAAGF